MDSSDSGLTPARLDREAGYQLLEQLQDEQTR
ncbi:MAG: hypothetical protein QOG76_3564, partial [Pseudonocardiales bacterium]|nr:hypothetical protein [Pseudonocardiales bacterium]